MSRIIVKNLPPRITQAEFKEHFATKGNITDAKLSYRDGQFRRFGFIGYESEDAAAEACSFFNGAYFMQHRITVEPCKDMGEKPVSWKEKVKQQREWEKQKKKEEDEKKKEKKKSKEKAKSAKEELIKKHEDDPAFKEFLELQETNQSKKTEGQEEEEENEDDDESGKLANEDVSDLEYLNRLKCNTEEDATIEGTKNIPKEHLFTIVIRAKKMCKTGKRMFTKQNIKEFLKPLPVKSLRIPKNVKMVAYVGFQTEKEQKRALMKDKSFIDGARVRVLKYVPQDENGNKQNALPWKAAQENLEKAEPVTESGSLFVRNLWFSVTEEDLRSHFEKYGTLVELTLPICKIQRRAKGFAKITYMFPQDAVRAMTELDGTTFKGRVLHVLPALEENKETDTGESSFKEKQDKKKKATAGSAHNWNTLFIGSAAVVDIMAERYNRSKQEILNTEGKQSAAVNLALGETQIVDETKRFLEESGISLEAFTKVGIQRSNTVILVKNLPAKTAAQELHELFSKYGELGRVVLPPSGITAVVEYLDPSEAKKGFNMLAYSKFKYLPLYLEWAPMDVFNTKYNEYLHEEQKKKKEKKKEKTENKEEPPSQLPEPDTTVFVKNLSFDTKEDAIKEHFEKAGEVYSLTIAKRNGRSQGYGFVQFMKRADAQKAVRNLQNSVLEDHTIEIKQSEKTLVTNIKSHRMIHDLGKQTSSKILVKNVPFQATSKEVRQLFATFGELKTVRLPKKFNSQEHRGFGFVDFVSQEDAKKAFEALSLSTHLYDRRLVLEWAKDDESVEELRKRTAENFLASGPKKRSKFELDVSNDAEEAYG